MGDVYPIFFTRAQVREGVRLICVLWWWSPFPPLLPHSPRLVKTLRPLLPDVGSFEVIIQSSMQPQAWWLPFKILSSRKSILISIRLYSVLTVCVVRMSLESSPDLSNTFNYFQCPDLCSKQIYQHQLSHPQTNPPYIDTNTKTPTHTHSFSLSLSLSLSLQLFLFFLSFIPSSLFPFLVLV